MGALTPRGFEGGLSSHCDGIDLRQGLDSATDSETFSIEPIWIRVGPFANSPTGEFLLNVRFVPELRTGAMIVCGALVLAALRGRRRTGRLH